MKGGNGETDLEQVEWCTGMMWVRPQQPFFPWAPLGYGDDRIYIISHPSPFGVNIEPRHCAAREYLNSLQEEGVNEALSKLVVWSMVADM